MFEQHSYTEDYNNPYKFNGKELQEELGLNMYDYGARNYDPALGRWMNVDPLAEKFPNFNPYNYVMQNPLNLIDPTGMEPEEGGGDPPTTKPRFRGIINVDNVLKGKKWIDYNLVGDCNASARQQNRESGKSKVEPDGAGYQTNMFIDKARQNQSNEKTPEVDLQKGVDVVINNLKDGKPVMAGVMYERKAGADHVLGVSSNDNNNVATNHYITIVGMGVEEGGFPYFSYYDNFVCDMGDSRESIATDVKENRFYLRIDSKGNYFFSDNSPKTGGDCLGDHFILTEIRNNH